MGKRITLVLLTASVVLNLYQLASCFDGAVTHTYTLATVEMQAESLDAAVVLLEPAWIGKSSKELVAYA